MDSLISNRDILIFRLVSSMRLTTLSQATDYIGVDLDLTLDRNWIGAFNFAYTRKTFANEPREYSLYYSISRMKGLYYHSRFMSIYFEYVIPGNVLQLTSFSAQYISASWPTLQEQSWRLIMCFTNFQMISSHLLVFVIT